MNSIPEEDRPSRDQPYYHLFAENSETSYIAYVSEQNLLLDESGQPTDELLLVDEILTPDSSRYWPAENYEPGRDQESFDKQYIRNWLQDICDRGEWDKTPPGPGLPEDVITNSLARYDEASQRLFGS